MANSVASPEVQTIPKGCQIILRLPNPPDLLTVAIHFPSRDEAISWGGTAVHVMKFFVHVDAWKVIRRQQPPTHSYQDGKVIRLGSILTQ